MGKAVILATMRGILFLTGCFSANAGSVVSSENPTIVSPPPSHIETESPLPAESIVSAPTPDPFPSPTPVPDPEERTKDYAAEMLSRMDLHERVCQMFMVLPEALFQGEYVKTAGADVMHTLHEYPVGGVILMGENAIIGTRAYSDNYQEAASLVASAVQGFLDGGILCTLKHFPGHGNTNEDSHGGAAYSYRTFEELREGEFFSFMSGAAVGVPMIMASHITVPELADQPASLSYTILTEALRDELGFDGIIVTDAMNMGTIANAYYPGEAEILAIEVGADLILCPSDLTASVSAVETAVEEGTISANRIDDSVLRILTLRLEKGGIPLLSNRSEKRQKRRHRKADTDAFVLYYIIVNNLTERSLRPDDPRKSFFKHDEIRTWIHFRMDGQRGALNICGVTVTACIPTKARRRI